MALVCAISGEEPEEPVASRRSGAVFEKRLIAKIIETEGKCPVTNDELTMEDLVEIKSLPKPVRPRTAATASVPGVLSLLQTEWDELMVEAYNTKQQLDATRQELSQALYQHDAACRVIARLVRERDETRAELSKHRDGVSDRLMAAATPGPGPQPMEEEEEEAADAGEVNAFTDEILEKMKAKYAELSKPRKKRAMPADLATKDALGGYGVAYEKILHEPAGGGITCLTVHPVKRHIVLTGAADKTCIVHDASSGEQLGHCVGHTKTVRSVAFHPTELIALSGGDDQTCRIWRSQEGESNEGFAEAAVFSGNLKAAVSAVTMHPTGDYFAAAAVDGAWAMFDIAEESCFRLVPKGAEGPLSSIAFHPDGLIMCTGLQQQGSTQLWDLRQKGACVATLQGHAGAVSAIGLSENGYTLATGGQDGFAVLFDLRKVAETARLSLGSAINALSFDPSGTYLAAAGNGNLKVFTPKDRQEVCEYPLVGDAATGLGWGRSAKWLAVADAGRRLRVFGERPTAA